MHNPFPISPVSQPTFLSTAPSAAALTRFLAHRDGPQEVTPAVRVVARKLGVDVSLVSGTGAAGRITLKDVRAAAAANGR